MKQFLFVALLGLLSFSAGAHRKGHGHSHHCAQSHYHNGHRGGQGSNYRAKAYANPHHYQRGNSGYGYSQTPSGNAGKDGTRYYNQQGAGQGGPMNQRYEKRRQ
jgi:hypothetical protein